MNAVRINKLYLQVHLYIARMVYGVCVCVCKGDYTLDRFYVFVFIMLDLFLVLLARCCGRGPSEVCWRRVQRVILCVCFYCICTSALILSGCELVWLSATSDFWQTKAKEHDELPWVVYIKFCFVKFKANMCFLRETKANHHHWIGRCNEPKAKRISVVFTIFDLRCDRSRVSSRCFKHV